MTQRFFRGLALAAILIHLLPAALAQEARTAVDGGATTNGGGTPTSPMQIVRDVQGPPIDVGTEAAPYEPGHHALIVENLHATVDDLAESDHSTGGLAIVLHSHGQSDDLGVFDLDLYDPDQVVLNTINRNDHFITFFREDADGTSEIVGRVEGLSFWDIGAISEELQAFFLDSGHMPLSWLALDVTFNDPSTWIQWDPPQLSHPGFQAPVFDGGELPYFAFNNLSCEGNANEVCIDLGVTEIDLSWDPGEKPTIDWGSVDDFMMGLELDPGSLDATPPLSFGDPFITVDQDAVDAFGADLWDVLGSAASTAMEIVDSPVGFAAKYFFSLRGGVTYESGSGDYAEWLERLDPAETLQIADVVGVHGGKVTRKTAGAEHTMVVSYKPIVLGNMPDEARQERFEKVAFMGQTLVKVRGVVRGGDFIVPSGLDDGTGVAVSPEAIRADQLGGVVGVAWGSGGVPGQLGLVNVAVGLQPVEVARIVSDQQAQLERLETEVVAMRAALAEMETLGERVDAMSAALETLQGRLEEAPSIRVASK